MTNFKNELGKQVLILDGAMGTMVQNLELSDAAFGGPEFKMLTDLLVFSRPDDLEGIHLEYLQAGANLIETDTFGASPLRLKEFDFSKFDPSDLKAVPEQLDLKNCSLEMLTLKLNIEGCRIAKRAIEKYRAQRTHQMQFDAFGSQGLEPGPGEPGQHEHQREEVAEEGDLERCHLLGSEAHEDVHDRKAESRSGHDERALNGRRNRA